MNKFCICIIILAFLSIITTSCSSVNSEKPNLIQSKRRFAEYLDPQEEKNPNAVDLSEGPKLRYDANFGPKKLDFDIKIVDPY